MKFHTLKITITILWAVLTAALFAEPPTGKYITRKSTLLTSRTMNNVTAVMECDGVKFQIPPGAITDPSLLVYIYKEEGTLVVKSGTPGKTIVRLTVDTNPQFAKPVEIHIPIKKGDKLPIAYAVDKSDEWEILTFKGLRGPGLTTAIYVTHKPVTVAWIIPE